MVYTIIWVCKTSRCKLMMKDNGLFGLQLSRIDSKNEWLRLIVHILRSTLDGSDLKSILQNHGFVWSKSKPNGLLLYLFPAFMFRMICRILVSLPNKSKLVNVLPKPCGRGNMEAYGHGESDALRMLSQTQLQSHSIMQNCIKEPMMESVPSTAPIQAIILILN